MKEIIEDGRELASVAAAVLAHDERGRSAGHILCGNIDPHFSGVGAIEPRIDFTVRRVHRELVDHTLRDAVLHGEFRRVGVSGPDDVVTLARSPGFNRLGMHSGDSGGRQGEQRKNTQQG